MAARSSNAATARAASSRSCATRGLTDKREIRVETAGGLIVPAARRQWRGDASTWACRASHPTTFRSSAAAAASPTRSMSTAKRSTCRCCRWAIRTRCRWWPTSTAAPVATQGPRIEHHPRFPRRVNAGYMQVIDRATIRLRVWERGAGETLACGTGACAAVVAGVRRGLIDGRASVHVQGGVLAIAWSGRWLSGRDDRAGRHRVRRRMERLTPAGCVGRLVRQRMRRCR